jgi:TIR domain
MSAASPRWDLFIAHAGPDQAEADALYDLLAPHLRVFLDTRCLLPGDDWPRVLPAALRASSMTVVLVSLRVDAAFYANEEIAIAIDLARRDPDRHRVIPVLLDDPDEHYALLPFGLRSKHGLFARTGEERARTAARLVEVVTGQAPAAGTHLDDVWGVHAPRSGDGAARPEAAAPLSYPPLRFLPDHGDEVLVRDPAALADLLERNPENGRFFLYRRYYERARWDTVNPGLCAALTALIEQRYPDDPAAGLTAALYLLDPRRPYRSEGESAEGYTALAAHVARHAERYRTALRHPRHPFWLYLSYRPNEAAREGARSFAAVFGALDERAGDADATLALHRLIVWLRGLDGEFGLPFAGAQLATPADLLPLPSAGRAAAAQALADPTSLLSVWTEERAPELSRLVATWRRVHPGDLETLPYALGAGVPCGAGEVRGPEDVAAGSAEVARALWGADESLRARVDRYLTAFHFVPLAAPALERLRALPDDPFAPAVAAYVARHAPELRDTSASGATREGRAAAGGAAELLREVAAPAFHALGAGAARPSPAAERTADDLAREAGDLLVARSLDGMRLGAVAEVLDAAARYAAAAEGRAGESALWARFLASADDAVTRAFRAGTAELADAPDALETAEARIAGSIPALRAGGWMPRLVERWDRERAAMVRLSSSIHARTEEERVRTESRLDGMERSERAAMRQQARRLPPLSGGLRETSRARTAAVLLAAGCAVLAVSAGVVLRALRVVEAEHAILFPDQPRATAELFGVMMHGEGPAWDSLMSWVMAGLLSIALCLPGLFLLTVGRRLRPSLATFVLLILVPGFLVLVAGMLEYRSGTGAAMLLGLGAVSLPACAVAGRRWLHWRKKTRQWIRELDENPTLAGELRTRRTALLDELAERERAWTASTRRALALAESPESVEPDIPPPGPGPIPEAVALSGGWTRSASSFPAAPIPVSPTGPRPRTRADAHSGANPWMLLLVAAAALHALAQQPRAGCHGHGVGRVDVHGTGVCFCRIGAS